MRWRVWKTIPYYEHETGLHYNRYRYYEPYSARYVSKDPIGLFGGINTSKYVNNPNQWIDAKGLQVGAGFNTKSGNIVFTDIDSKEKIVVKGFTGGHIDSSSGAIIPYGNNSEKPIPPSKYYITEHPNPKPGQGWYGLLAIDDKIDDSHTDQYGKVRSGFRLHSGSVSWGCVTINSTTEQGVADWNKVDNMLRKTKLGTVEYEDKWYYRNKKMKLYGILEVR